ncbi:MAG: hypothetical protein Q9190_008034 [Brigantiaea leucoxantha]
MTTDTKIKRTPEEVDEFWQSVKIEPSSDELKVLIRADLEKLWHFLREAEFRQSMKIQWATTDSYKIVLKDEVGNLELRKIKYLCNKSTSFYWLQSAQSYDSTGQRSITPVIILGAIYEEWRRFYNSKPNIEHGHFFANPIRITATGPSTISEIINAHLRLCAQASILMNKAQKGFDRNGFNPQLHHLFPLYRAIIVIIDHLWKPDEGHVIARDFHKWAECQPVLVALTGSQEGLSAPISLEDLHSQSLPLERSDGGAHNVDVVKVPLTTAVQFILKLEAKEEIAIPASNADLLIDINLSPSDTLKKSRPLQARYNPAAWADALVSEAEKFGYDNVFQTRDSMRRVLSDLIGEDYSAFEHLPFKMGWK